MSHASPASHHASMSSMVESQEYPSSGGQLVSTEGLALPLERTHLSCQAGGGVARVILEQRFRNPHDQPLWVTYKLPLPADGAVSGFAFRIREVRIAGQVDRRQAARERFETAIAEGKTAALLDQERPDVFTQEVGNIPAGQEIVCEVEIDQRLTWLPDGAWEWRFPTVVGPRYMGAGGRVADADKVAVTVSSRSLATRMTLALTIADPMAGGAAPSSPSHPLRVVTRESAQEVCFKNDSSVRLDRDVVVQWAVASLDVGVSMDVVRPSGEAHTDCAYGLLTVVPPRDHATMEPLPRDLIVLIDTSGSMSGRPLDQAKRVVCAMIDTLGDRDRLELIEFGSRPLRWRKEPIAATRDGRREAMRWVRKLRASGATEMHAAVLEALRPLRSECQRQVVLVTDGYIGFEHEIIETVLTTLPKNCRLHTLGVGSSVNRSLTRPAARVGNGVELVIGLHEDAERVARCLLDRTTAPLVTDLSVTGHAVMATAPLRLPDLFAASPALISLQLDPQGGPITVRGTMTGGTFEHTVLAPARLLGEGNQAICALYGRERVEDLETRTATRGHRGDIDAEIERIGLDFQISTRLTSWVAVSDQVMSDAGAEGGPIRQVMPHEIPHGTQIESFGLRQAAPDVMFSLSEVLDPEPAARTSTLMGMPSILEMPRARSAPEASKIITAGAAPKKRAVDSGLVPKPPVLPTFAVQVPEPEPEPEPERMAVETVERVQLNRGSPLRTLAFIALLIALMTLGLLLARSIFGGGAHRDDKTIEQPQSAPAAAPPSAPANETEQP